MAIEPLDHDICRTGRRSGRRGLYLKAKRQICGDGSESFTTALQFSLILICLVAGVEYAFRKVPPLFAEPERLTGSNVHHPKFATPAKYIPKCLLRLFRYPFHLSSHSFEARQSFRLVLFGGRSSVEPWGDDRNERAHIRK
jgi:hypothetical protein